eukprot:UN32130
MNSQCSESLHDLQILSWNLWGVPFASRGTLNIPHNCGKYLIENVKFDKKLPIIICFQEAFALPTGHLGWLLLYIVSPLEYIPLGIGWFIMILSTFISILLSWVTPTKTWDPKDFLHNTLKSLTPNCIGRGGQSFVMNRFGVYPTVDSGLAIYTNLEVIDSGFIHFERSCGFDAMARKGIQWGYLEKNILIVNTHLNDADGPAKDSQLQQIQNFLTSLTSSLVVGELRHHIEHVFIAGDINVCVFSPTRRAKLSKFFPGFSRISKLANTSVGGAKCLDQIYHKRLSPIQSEEEPESDVKQRKCTNKTVNNVNDNNFINDIEQEISREITINGISIEREVLDCRVSDHFPVVCFLTSERTNNDTKRINKQGKTIKSDPERDNIRLEWY